mmetsp:Transcript_3948/g.4335  ORF Transcript_3948/g.4335 Transcript_3948/m.4335 type:complete len:80 (+) Transcript_3948:139-378(+)
MMWYPSYEVEIVLQQLGGLRINVLNIEHTTRMQSQFFNGLTEIIDFHLREGCAHREIQSEISFISKLKTKIVVDTLSLV